MGQTNENLKSYHSKTPFWEMGKVLSLNENNILFPRNVGPILSSIFLSLTIKDFTGCIYTNYKDKL